MICIGLSHEGLWSFLERRHAKIYFPRAIRSVSFVVVMIVLNFSSDPSQSVSLISYKRHFLFSEKVLHCVMKCTSSSTCPLLHVLHNRSLLGTTFWYLDQMWCNTHSITQAVTGWFASRMVGSQEGRLEVWFTRRATWKFDLRECRRPNATGYFWC